MNINTLTIKAQEALQAALSLARERGQQAVEPLHLLAALIREDDSLSTFLLGRVGGMERRRRDGVGGAGGRWPAAGAGGGAVDHHGSRGNTVSYSHLTPPTERGGEV